jgi:hypothetical protein
MFATEERVDSLESLVDQIAQAQMQTNITLRAHSEELREFKNEMLEFKDEMREFKNEMLEFKDEMQEFRKETEEFKKESLAERKRMNKQWGDLANKLGTIVEDIAAPNLVRLATEEFGLDPLQDILIRARRTNRIHPDGRTEFDVICASPGKILLAEMKSTPALSAIEGFRDKLDRFWEFFPEYQGRELIGIFASWSLEDDIRKAVRSHGLYGMAMGDDTMEIVVRPDTAAA